MNKKGRRIRQRVFNGNRVTVGLEPKKVESTFSLHFSSHAIGLHVPLVPQRLCRMESQWQLPRYKIMFEL